MNKGEFGFCFIVQGCIGLVSCEMCVYQVVILLQLDKHTCYIIALALAYDGIEAEPSLFLILGTTGISEILKLFFRIEVLGCTLGTFDCKGKVSVCL